MGSLRPLPFPATQILSHSSLTFLPLLTCLPLFCAPSEAPTLHLTSLLPLESLTISLRLSELQDSTLSHPALQTLPRIHISPTAIPAAKTPTVRPPWLPNSNNYVLHGAFPRVYKGSVLYDVLSYLSLGLYIVCSGRT